jgi:hypothetical protein
MESGLGIASGGTIFGFRLVFAGPSGPAFFVL